MESVVLLNGFPVRTDVLQLIVAKVLCLMVYLMLHPRARTLIYQGDHEDYHFPY